MIERPVAVCPRCKKDDRLTVNVDLPAWQSCDVVPGEDGTIRLELTDRGNPSREALWDDAQALTNQLWCGCGWHGSLEQLRRVGWDGKPIKSPPPGQLSII